MERSGGRSDDTLGWAREESGRRWSGDGFLELPRSLREALRDARERAEAGEVDSAIESLVAVGTDRFGVFVSERERMFVERALAHALVLRALDRRTAGGLWPDAARLDLALAVHLDPDNAPARAILEGSGPGIPDVLRHRLDLGYARARELLELQEDPRAEIRAAALNLLAVVDPEEAAVFHGKARARTMRLALYALLGLAMAGLAVTYVAHLARWSPATSWLHRVGFVTTEGARESFRAALLSGGDGSAVAAVHAIEGMGGEASVAVLVEGLAAASGPARRAALAALGRMGGDGAMATLLGVDPGEDRVVEDALVASLVRIVPATLLDSVRSVAEAGRGARADVADRVVRLREAPGADAALASPRFLLPGDQGRGTLAAGESTRHDGAFVQTWPLLGLAGDRLRVDMTSESLDAYLLLDGPGLMTPMENDDDGPGTGARLDVELPATGVYQVRASSFGAGRGPYALTVSRDPLDFASAPSVPETASASGLPEAELLRREAEAAGRSLGVGWVAHGTLGEPTERHAWVVEVEADVLVVVSLESADFDTYLTVDAPGLARVDDDDGGGRTDSRVRLVPTRSGIMVVTARAYAAESEERAGSYDLRVSGREADAARNEALSRGRRLTLGEARAGRLEGGGARHAWVFDGEGGVPVVISVRSDEMDAFLVVDSPELEEVLEDDDGGTGTDARLTVTLPSSGSYVVWVRSFGSSYGAYTVEVTPGS